MALMKQQLGLKDYSGARSMSDIIRIGNENNRILAAAYLAIFNDLNFKQWQYFSVGGKRWRIGPDPDGNDFLVQELTGSNWRNQSHWTTATTSFGGAAG